jgi:hypothetical protein
MMNPIVLGGATGLGLGAGLGVGGAKVYKKVTGKTAGAPGSSMHILTNDKLDKKAKAAVIKEQFVASGKDTINVGKVVVGSAAAASLLAGNSTKVAGLLNSAKTKVGTLLSRVTVDNKNLKDVVANSTIYKKLNALPTPAKAAIAVGTAVLALVAPLATLVGSKKAGYIEGKHEANTLKRNIAMQADMAMDYASQRKNPKIGCVA